MNEFESTGYGLCASLFERLEGNQPTRGPLVPENFRKVLDELEGFIGF